MNKATLQHYRRHRANGYTAEAALNSARSDVHFRKQLSASVRETRKRSAAARKGWKTRRRNAK